MRQHTQEIGDHFAVPDEGVEHIKRVLTLFFGPDDVLLTVEVKFRDELSSRGVRSAVAWITEKVKVEPSEIKRVYLRRICYQQ